jgi:hypothetical protein
VSSDSSLTRVAGDDGEILDESASERFEFGHQTCYQRGREQTLWTVHQSPEWEAGPARRKHTVRWTLRVAADGVVSTSRTIPYDGQRRFSTEDRPNRADKSSEYRLSVEEVLERHAALCSKRGAEVSVDDLRERVLAVLDRDDVAANNNSEVDLL